MIKGFLTSAVVAAGLAAPSFAAPLDLGDLVRAGTVSSGSGGLFYDGVFLTDDFLNPLTFDAGPTGGDFAGLTDNLLLYDFFDPSFSSFTIDAFGTGELFTLDDVGFSGDTIEFLMTYDSGLANPYPGAAGAVLSFTSSDFATAPFTLDDAASLEDFFLFNSDPFTLEYATSVSFSVQALVPIPLPAGLPLLLVGLGALAVLRHRAPGRS